MMPTFRKKPIEIEAVQWTGENHGEIRELENSSARSVKFIQNDKSLIIATLEGDHKGSLGDYIIRGVAGELYLCKPEIFKETYEAV